MANFEDAVKILFLTNDPRSLSKDFKNNFTNTDFCQDLIFTEPVHLR